MRRLAVCLILFATSANALERDIPFFPPEGDTCLGSGPTSGPGETHEVTLIRHNTPDPLSEDAAFTRLRAARGLATEPRISPVWASIRIRGQLAPLLAQMGCSPDGAEGVTCGVDCDGGSVHLKPDGDRFTLVNRGLRTNGSCGGAGRVWWRDGPADTTFTLHRLDGPSCTKAIEAMRPGFATAGLPVFDRLARGRTCFARTYDAAHLKAHPTQTVTSARLSYTGLDPDDAGRVRARVTVRFRSGKTASQELACQPERFDVQCFPPRDDGELLISRVGPRSLRVSTRGIDGNMDAIGGTKLAEGDDVFVLHEVPCAER